MVQRNEVWASGAKPGDAPIEVDIVAIPRETLLRESRRSAMLAFVSGQTTAKETRVAVQSIIAELREKGGW